MAPVVAAYSNGETGAVVLFAQNGAGGLTALDTVTDKLTGSSPAITAVDVDSDGIAEAVVVFEQPRGGSATWIFRLADQKLTLISPTNDSGGSILVSPQMLNLRGTGALDIIENIVSGSRQDPEVQPALFTLQSGKYVAGDHVDFFHVFYRDKQTPSVETANFTIPVESVSDHHRLLVANGGSSGADYRVASGVIRLNGVVVSGESDFNENRASWSTPVPLQAENTLTVELRGKPRGRIAVAILTTQ